MTTRLYVSAYRIGRRIQGGAADDPITVEAADGSVTHCRAARILGPSVIEYHPEAPNDAGARCWVTTDSVVEIEERV